MLNQAIGQTVRELRLRKGLSQEQLADDIDSHQVYISEIERGLKEPSLSFLMKLSNLMGMSLSDLIVLVEKKL